MKSLILVPQRPGAILLRLLPLCFVLLLSACSKEGDPGPKGEDGKNGNPEVTAYDFGPQTINGGALNLTYNMTQSKMDSSFLLVYYNPEAELASAWYAMPGLGSGAQYDTRYLTYAGAQAGQYVLAVRLMALNGTAYGSSVKFRKLRMFVVPAVKIVNARQAAPVDFNDYHAVVKYYGITE